MTPAKKPEPAVAAKPARRRPASMAKALAAPPAVEAVKAVKAGDVGARAPRSARRGVIPVLKTATASAETTVKRAVTATDKKGRP
jgi:hypothetical protein